MKYDFNEIGGSSEWKRIDKIDKGWSEDDKYYIEDELGKKHLLRIGRIEKYKKRKYEYEQLKRLDDVEGVNISRAEGFGIFNGGKNIYTIMTWVEGVELKEKINDYSEEEQYRLGSEAGKILKEIHSVSAPKEIEGWKEKYNRKLDRNLKKYEECELSYDDGEYMVKFIESNRREVEDVEQVLHHGDYHIGNMVIDEEGKLGVIDFDRMDYGEPWEELNRIVWSVEEGSSDFASGVIDGYFEGSVPERFFRLLAIYIASNSLGSLPWSIKYGDKEIETMRNQARKILEWYQNFNQVIPIWYRNRG